MARVGYTRVSSEAQNLDRQLDGIAVDKVFADKARYSHLCPETKGNRPCLL